MRPTAMQRPLSKEGGKIKNPAPPPPPPPKTSTTITVVCNGTRSPSSPRPPSMDMLNDQAGPGTDNGVYKSSLMVEANSTREPASAFPRDKQGAAPMPTSPKPSANSPQGVPSLPMKSPPPVLPRSNSGGNMTGISVSVNGNGHSSHGEAGKVTDFYSSLPSLPSDDDVAYSHTSVGPSSPKETPNPSSPTSPTTIIQSTAGSTKIIVNSSAETNPPSVPGKPVKTPDTAPKPCPPPVSRKPVVSRPSPLTDIAENGTYSEEPEGEEDEFPAERFYVNMKACNGDLPGSDTVRTQSTFAGRRDVTNPKSLDEKQIVSSKGTVRGFKNRVRAGIVTFVDPTASKFNYRVLEKDRIVLYTTSMTVVRETYDRCKASRNILQNHMVRFEQKDLYMSLENQRQLRERLDSAEDIPLPQIFIDGIHLGGANDLEKLNESGELRRILHSFPKIQVRTMCGNCGGYRFVPCAVCHGSKKSVHRNNFTEEFCALRCMHCNENGLQRCADCVDQQE